MSKTEDVAGELDLFDIVRVLWGGRWLILLVTTLCGAGGVAYALLAPQWYRAEVVMMPAGKGGIGGNLGQLGSLAALAGVSIGTQGGDAQLPLAVLRSSGFVRDFIEERDLLQTLFADSWDAGAGRWKQTPEPDVRDAVAFFEARVRKVTEDKKTGEIRMSITWRDPAVAAAWANELAARANERLRLRALAEAERNVRFLQQEIKDTPVASLQQSIGKVLESEMEKMMLARGTDEYAFRVVDEAVAPKKRSWPQRRVVVAASVLFGLVLSMAAVLLRQGLRARDRRKPLGEGAN